MCLCAHAGWPPSQGAADRVQRVFLHHGHERAVAGDWGSTLPGVREEGCLVSLRALTRAGHGHLMHSCSVWTLSAGWVCWQCQPFFWAPVAPGLLATPPSLCHIVRGAPSLQSLPLNPRTEHRETNPQPALAGRELSLLPAARCAFRPDLTAWEWPAPTNREPPEAGWGRSTPGRSTQPRPRPGGGPW